MRRPALPADTSTSLLLPVAWSRQSTHELYSPASSPSHDGRCATAACHASRSGWGADDTSRQHPSDIERARSNRLTSAARLGPSPAFRGTERRPTPRATRGRTSFPGQHTVRVVLILSSLVGVRTDARVAGDDPGDHGMTGRAELQAGLPEPAIDGAGRRHRRVRRPFRRRESRRSACAALSGLSWAAQAMAPTSFNMSASSASAATAPQRRARANSSAPTSNS